MIKPLGGVDSGAPQNNLMSTASKLPVGIIPSLPNAQPSLPYSLDISPVPIIYRDKIHRLICQGTYLLPLSLSTLPFFTYRSVATKRKSFNA